MTKKPIIRHRNATQTIGRMKSILESIRSGSEAAMYDLVPDLEGKLDDTSPENLLSMRKQIRDLVKDMLNPKNDPAIRKDRPEYEARLILLAAWHKYLTDARFRERVKAMW